MVEPRVDVLGLVVDLPAKGRRPSLRERLALTSAASIGPVAIGATALSLSDLADSIGEVAHVAGWKAYALATALDLNFVSTESFSLFAGAAVSRATRRATTTKVITLTMSDIANAFAMASHAEGLIRVAQAGAAGGRRVDRFSGKSSQHIYRSQLQFR